MDNQGTESQPRLVVNSVYELAHHLDRLFTAIEAHTDALALPYIARGERPPAEYDYELFRPQVDALATASDKFSRVTQPLHVSEELALGLLIGTLRRLWHGLSEPQPLNGTVIDTMRLPTQFMEELERVQREREYLPRAVELMGLLNREQFTGSGLLRALTADAAKAAGVSPTELDTTIDFIALLARIHTGLVWVYTRERSSQGK